MEVDGGYVLDHVKLSEDGPHGDAHARQRHRHRYYAVKSAPRTWKTHRPVGLGIMGFQDAPAQMMRTPYASQDAMGCRPLDEPSATAYWASTSGEERGRHSSTKGSLWDRGIMPHGSFQAAG